MLALIIVSGCLTLGQMPVAAGHAIDLDERVLTSDDGLLLGNGDLSVSVYETADRIIWRFGKNDAWDRRLDLSDDPKPAHIDEIAKGIKDEGWKCPPYGEGPPVATKGTQHPERMKELCLGTPPGYTKRPYPCPKPVGELAMQLPADQMGLRIHQHLDIERATLEITCAWPSGASLKIETFIPPTPNVLVVNWKLENWTDQNRTGSAGPPVWFSLYRWADPTIQAFAAKFFGDYRHGAFRTYIDPKVTPLPVPTVKKVDDISCIEQTFPPDPLFKNGFSYLMAPLAPGYSVQPVDMGPTGEARLHLMPEKNEGTLAVLVATTSAQWPSSSEKWPGFSKTGADTNQGTPAECLAKVKAQFHDTPEIVNQWAEANLSSASEFWSKSRVAIANPLLENLWYETLHARRCVTRHDTPPPGLFLPSTVQDYSHWHGDYHTNYNLQEPFWGDYTANHLELADAYANAIDYFLPIGRKIAKDYYNCRGVFVQLSGFPIRAEEDPLGCVPMGRMAYMTGWAINQYWWRYLYSMDKDWLARNGYPVIRDAALFYTDFLKKGEDGLYHAFPSNQGEDGFTGDAKDYTDQPQVMQHMRYCLRAAIRASEVLDTDADLRAQWRDRLEHAAGDDGKPPKTSRSQVPQSRSQVQLGNETQIEQQCYEANPPEFGTGRPYRPQPETYDAKAWPPVGDASHVWYCGQYPWSVIQHLRSGDFIVTRDMPVFEKIVQRWRHPNGLIWGMAIANYGHAGAWTESLGAIAPLEEMMLQSWDGSLRIFPAWPKDLDARFDDFRAEGAFLVSAAWSKGVVTRLQIKSEKGGKCRLICPWPGGAAIVNRVQKDSHEKETPVDLQAGLLSFDTAPANVYNISKK